MDWYQFSLKRFSKLCVHRQHRWKKFSIWFSFSSSLCLAQIINFDSEILSGVHFMFRTDSTGEHSLIYQRRKWFLFFLNMLVLFLLVVPLLFVLVCCFLFLFCFFIWFEVSFIVEQSDKWQFIFFFFIFEAHSLFTASLMMAKLLLSSCSNCRAIGSKKINLLLKRVPASHMRCDVPTWREWRTYLVLFFLSV